MATIKIPRIEVRYKEAFVLKLLYEALHDWCWQYDYRDDERKDTGMEKLYSVQDTSAGKTFFIWWRTKKEITKRICYRIHIDFIGLAINDVEIVQDNKKIKAQKGELDIFLDGYIDIKDDDWKKIPLLNYFADYFLKRLMKKELEDHKKKIYSDLYKIEGIIKKYFELHQFIEDKEGYHPAYGYE